MECKYAYVTDDGWVVAASLDDLKTQWESSHYTGEPPWDSLYVEHVGSLVPVWAHAGWSTQENDDWIYGRVDLTDETETIVHDSFNYRLDGRT